MGRCATPEEQFTDIVIKWGHCPGAAECKRRDEIEINLNDDKK